MVRRCVICSCTGSERELINICPGRFGSQLCLRWRQFAPARFVDLSGNERRAFSDYVQCEGYS